MASDRKNQYLQARLSHLLVKAILLSSITVIGLNAFAGIRFGVGRSVGRAPVSVPLRAPVPSNALAPTSVIAPASASSANVSPSPGNISGTNHFSTTTPPRPTPIAAQNLPPFLAQQQTVQRGLLRSVLGGVATGLDVSWLIHSLGFGQLGWDAGGGNIIGLDEIVGGLLIFILGLAVVVFVRNKLKSSGSDSQLNAQSGGHKAFTSPSSLRFEGQGTATNPAQFQNYKSKNVGNDASARPWEGYGVDTLDNQTHEGMPHYSGIPQGFDVRGFVNTAKQVFMTLQVAWDRSDMKTLHAMLTDQMLSEIKSQLNEREQQSNGVQNQTDVVTLQAELLGIQESPNEYTSSVEFSGLIREDPTQGPAPFREVWTLCRPKDGSTGWLVSGVQALQ